MDQLICLSCNRAAGFTVTEGWPPIIYTVSAERVVVEENSKAGRDFEVACNNCGEEADEELWGEIFDLSQGWMDVPPSQGNPYFEVVRIMHGTDRQGSL